MRRSAVIWVLPQDSGRSYPLWHVWHEGQAFVLTGPGEQELPLCSRARIVVRSKDKPAERAAEWTASVRVVDPATPEWNAVIALLAERRLHAVEGAEQRWAAHCLVRALVPAT